MTSIGASTMSADAMPTVTGEFAMSAKDFQEIAGIVKANAGIELSTSKATLVYSRLAKRVREHNLSSFHDYCDLVRSDQEERQRMISALTTNVTRFFRESHHFDHLRDSVLAPLVSAARRGEKIRMWSAACSTGQEPYSMALTLLSVLPDAPRLDVRILATDLNPMVVEHGRRGIYEQSEINDIPRELRQRWFSPAVTDNGPGWQIAPEARSLITFRTLNLLETWPMKGSFHAIFCRNVVIYFSRQTQTALWDRFEKLLPEGGALYIGHSERLSDNVLRKLKQDGITTSIRPSGAQS